MPINTDRKNGAPIQIIFANGGIRAEYYGARSPARCHTSGYSLI
jgi:hypothetical protein